MHVDAHYILIIAHMQGKNKGPQNTQGQRESRRNVGTKGLRTRKANENRAAKRADAPQCGAEKQLTITTSHSDPLVCFSIRYIACLACDPAQAVHHGAHDDIYSAGH